MKMILAFISVFFFIILCFVAISFCGGMEFGTPAFGWLMGLGFMVAIFCGVGAAIEIDSRYS